MMMSRLLSITLLLCACAGRAPEPQSIPPSRPHVVVKHEESLGCPKTHTSVPLNGAWSVVDNEGAIAGVRHTDGCKALLVARASRRMNAGEDFAAAWAFAERIAEESWFAASHIEPRSIAEDRFRDERGGVIIAYERDELAELTCSFLLVGESKCLDVAAVFDPMTRAPAALHAPPRQEAEPPPRVLPECAVHPSRCRDQGRNP